MFPVEQEERNILHITNRAARAIALEPESDLMIRAFMFCLGEAGAHIFLELIKPIPPSYADEPSLQ